MAKLIPVTGMELITWHRPHQTNVFVLHQFICIKIKLLYSILHLYSNKHSMRVWTKLKSQRKHFLLASFLELEEAAVLVSTILSHEFHFRTCAIETVLSWQAGWSVHMRKIWPRQAGSQYGSGETSPSGPTPLLIWTDDKLWVGNGDNMRSRQKPPSRYAGWLASIRTGPYYSTINKQWKPIKVVHVN